MRDYNHKETHRGVTIDVAAARVAHKQEDEGWDEGHAVADDGVDPEVLPEGGGAGAMEKDEKDIDGHGQRPPRVRLHEPGGVSA